MKASELIEQLQESIRIHGDRTLKSVGRDIVGIRPNTIGASCMAVFEIKIETNGFETISFIEDDGEDDE